MKTNYYLLLAYFFFALSVLNGCKKDSAVQTARNVGSANVGASAQTDSMIATPVGPLPKSHVFLVENGYHLDVTTGHVLKIEDATGHKAADFGLLHPTGVQQTPTQNPLLGIVRSLKSPRSAVAGTAVNWQTYAQWESNNLPITSFSTSWAVPGPPTITTDQQQIFIFNGIAESDNGNILQPVLQWGQHSNDGGGTYWSIANWYVWGSGDYTYAAFSSPITVSSTTEIQGVITETGTKSDGSYNYTSIFTGYNNPLTVVEGNSNQGAVTYNPTNTTTKENVTFPTIEEQVWAYETLEAYNYKNGGAYDVYQASDYPSQLDVPMTNISLSVNNSPASYSWTPEIGQNVFFGEHTNVINNGEVDIYFHPQPQRPVISYTSPDTYYTGFPITALSPTNTGGAPTSYSVSPALPSALSLNTTTGVISGTPIGPASSGNYTVTATNSAGNGTFPISITINQSNLFVFNIYSSNSSVDNFLLSVNGINEGGPHGVSQTNSIVGLPGYGYLTNSTIIMEITFGPMPTSATLYGVGAPINGVISGTNITFNNCNLSSTTAVTIDIN